GHHGVLAAEAVWLALQGAEDVLMGYPTVDRGALAELGSDSALLGRITLMVDDVAQLDLIRDAVGSAGVRPRICLDVDASLRLGPRTSGAAVAAA
ncbi:amino acid deaminase/aldolase, partial [Rhodococcus hoagii]|nr:amino acid deaminase/aldolase [Prescottella equi]